MSSCCIKNCKSHHWPYKQHLSYFEFPLHNTNLLRKWITHLKISKWFPTYKHRVCSLHFYESDIDVTDRFPKLKDSAIPTILSKLQKTNLSIKNDHVSNSLQNKIHANVNSNITLIKQDHKFNTLTNTSSTSDLSSVVLLCTPTKNSDAPDLNLQSLNSTNLNIKKIPLKTNLKNNSNSSNEFTSPYLIILSEIQNESAQLKTKNSSNKPKVPVLSIQIDKKLNYADFNKPCSNLSKCKISSNQLTESNTQINKNNNIDEVEVDDISSSKVVVFRLDISTGKITVIKREKSKKSYQTEKSCETSSLQNTLGYSIDSLEENNSQKENLHTTNESNIICKQGDNLNILAVDKESKTCQNESTEIQEKNENQAIVFNKRKYSDVCLQKMHNVQNKQLDDSLVNSSENSPIFNNTKRKKL